MANSKYNEWTKEQIIEELTKLKKRKKYGLVWEDKFEDVVEQCKKELPVLEEISKLEIKNDPNKPVNILIEGDNFHALSVLNYTHKGKIDVIYIDPPYNTGAKDWKYNNNFVDAEDPYRHTKWLSFMAHRLRISKDLLSKDGIICITIDDYEIAKLWMLMEEIFGEINFLGTIAIRINPGGRKSKRKIAAQHEYALFFSRHINTSVATIIKNPDQKSHSYKQDENENWYEERNLRKEGADSLAKPNSDRFYPIYYDPKTGKVSTKDKLQIEVLPIDTNKQKRIWRRSKDVIDDMYSRKEVFAKETKYGVQIYFRFKGGLTGETPKSFWDDTKYSASEYGTQTLDSIMGKREMFNFPKSPYATADCIRVASGKKDAVILDFFAGSGTTAQSVLELNELDEGSRSFILCTNNENKIAEEVCYQRVKNVINGYKYIGTQRKILLDTKLTFKVLQDIDLLLEKVEKLTLERKADFDKIETKIEDNSLRIYGIKKIKDMKAGLGGNLKYYKTNFVKTANTDASKRNLVNYSTEMLCLKEGCFESVKSNEHYKIFKNNKNKYMGIVYDDEGIEDYKNEIKNINKFINTYVFSLDDSAREEEFEEVLEYVNLRPIPEVILNVYRRIFK